MRVASWIGKIWGGGGGNGGARVSAVIIKTLFFECTCGDCVGTWLIKIWKHRIVIQYSLRGLGGVLGRFGLLVFVLALLLGFG